MTIQEVYKELNGNYDEILARFRSPALVQRFAMKFVNDGSYNELTAALAEGRGEDAFRAAHTLKGVAKNLSFTKLGDSSAELTELLRDGDVEAGRAYLPKLTADYEMTVGALKKFG